MITTVSTLQNCNLLSVEYEINPPADPGNLFLFEYKINPPADPGNLP